MKFLVVDDFSTMRRIIKNLLNDLGYANVTEADDGATALPMLQGGNFDFLIEQIIEAAQAGVNGYVIKPFTAVTLKEKIDKILETRANAA
jgi:two-component system, chemotaxis family, chemotaxis protein CheY